MSANKLGILSVVSFLLACLASAPVLAQVQCTASANAFSPHDFLVVINQAGPSYANLEDTHELTISLVANDGTIVPSLKTRVDVNERFVISIRDIFNKAGQRFNPFLYYVQIEEDSNESGNTLDHDFQATLISFPNGNGDWYGAGQPQSQIKVEQTPLDFTCDVDELS